MSQTIIIKHGTNPANIPVLVDGEMAYASSNNGLYIGTPSGNVQVNPASASSNIGFTPEGGMYILLYNRTGSASIKGTLVNASTSYDDSCEIVPISGTGNNKAIGVIYEDGIPNGSQVKVVVSGKAYVLLQDGNSSVHGQWCGTSTTQAGRMIVMNNPTGSSIHWREIGHCLQSVSAGTNKLCLINLHFN